jgi:glycosyltransferase involved in cell wall biosynthesis
MVDNIVSKGKIIYDASVLVSGNVSGNIHKTGLCRVSYELLKEIVKSDKFELYLFDIFHRERELIKYVQKEFPQCNRIRVHSLWFRLLIFPLVNLADFLRNVQESKINKAKSIIAGLLKNSLLLIEKAARKIERLFFIEKNLRDSFNQCDIYYSTYFPIPEQVRLNNDIKKVYTVHDMIPIIHPEYFSSPYNQRLVKEVVDNIGISDYVISVSESTKRDILKYRPAICSDHIIVVPLAASSVFCKETNQEKIEHVKIKNNIKCDKYILSVSTIEPRKNLMLLIKTYKELLKQNNNFDLKLVLIGSYGWNSNELMNEIKEINQTYNYPIILTGFVPDEDLSALYSGAYVFVYPSLYEGFGLPPLEAMQCGVPVIVSNTTSLPEVVGDSGILADPNSEMEFTEAITMLYSNKGVHDKLAQKSLLRASYFSWAKVSEKIIRVFESETNNNVK